MYMLFRMSGIGIMCVVLRGCMVLMGRYKFGGDIDINERKCWGVVNVYALGGTQ